ncbi:MAG: hypothetical protein Q8R48_03325, partial [Candidatus Omnitrophota bacterium]|nr:hypothetical protein [Candidatus Omnitrophota bacterium]
MKNFFIGIIILIIVSAAAIFIYRYQILQYSADKIIRSYLPDYVRVEKIDFDAKFGKIILSGFKILNPPDFSNNYLIEIEEVSAAYKMNGKNLVDGFEILNPVFKKPLLNIERLGDGKCNLSEMQAALNSKARVEGRVESTSKSAQSQSGPGMNPAGIIKLPEKYLLKNGKVVFMDRFGFSRPHMITFENVDAAIMLKFDDRYSKALRLSSTGEGSL